MATNQFIARFNPRSITKKGRYMVQDLVPDSAAKKAAGAAAIVAGVPGAREVALRDLGSGSEANMPMMPDIYGNQDIDPNSPGPAQITDPNAPQNIASQRQSTPEMGTERQEAITEQGRGARYDENSIMGLLSSFVGNPKANKAFDSTKPIGGANVPYQSAGGLQRFFGNQANQLNLGAQAAQSADWKQEAATAKERQGKIEDYRTQRNIDAEIDNAREDKRNTQAVTMFDKAQAAQREVLSLQNEYAKARNVEEQSDILKRMGVAHTNAMTLQDKALAATASNQGLQQSFQAKLANFNALMQGFQDANKITNLGEGFVARGGNVFGITKGSPGYGTTPPTDATVTPPLLGPSGRGPQVPQMDVGAPAMAPVTPTRSGFSLGGALNEPSQLAPGDGVRMGGALPAPVPAPAPAPAPAPKPTAVTSPRSAATGEQGEEVQGLLPYLKDYVDQGRELNLADEAPTTAQNRAGFMAGLGDLGRGVSESARSIKPLMLGGRLPRYTPEQGGGALGMLLNAPGAMMSPVEAGLNTVLRNPISALRGVDDSASMAEPSRMQDPKTMYMGDKEYKNYLRSKRLTD